MLRISPASILYSNTDKLSGPKLMWDGQENDRNVLCWGEFKLQHVFGKNTIKYQGQNPEANIEKKRLTVCQDRVFFFLILILQSLALMQTAMTGLPEVQRKTTMKLQIYLSFMKK